MTHIMQKHYLTGIPGQVHFTCRYDCVKCWLGIILNTKSVNGQEFMGWDSYESQSNFDVNLYFRQCPVTDNEYNMRELLK